MSPFSVDARRRAGRSRLSGLERRLRSPRGLAVLTLTTVGAAALVTVLMRAAGVPGWDDAAHLYKIMLLRDGDSIFWDTYWYGGGYGAITYGFVFYWLAQYVPGKLIAILAAGAVPVSFYLYVRDMWRIDDPWPAWGFALVMTAYPAHGQDPFVLALALTLVGLALLARGRPVWAALPVSVGIFANPMGLVVVTPFVIGDLIVRREARRRYLLWIAALAPAVLLRLAVGLAFSEPGAYLNETSQLLVFVGFAFVGVALAGVNAAHPRRPFLVLFLVYAALCVGSFITPGSPLGNNIGRFFMVFGLPLLLLLRHTRLRRPFRHGDLAVVAIAAFAILQFATATSHFFNAVERPQTTRAYFAPALAVAEDLRDPDYRLHVVALRRHWEALYFPEAGHPITRGWYRQADAIHNAFFYAPYDSDEYVSWLRSMGVRYVFLPLQAPLDPWSLPEAGLLEGSSAFRLVAQPGEWRVYRLVDAEPILVPEAAGPGGPARGDISFFGHERIIFSVTAPGVYRMKVTSSPYWVLDGPGRVEPRRDRFMDLHLRRAGTYTLRFEVTPATALDSLAGRFRR